MTTCRLYPFLTKRKLLLNIDGVCVVDDKSHSTPWLALSDTTYSNVVSVPVENTIDIYNHISPPIPQVAPVRLTLHGQRCIHYENIFTSCRRDYKTFLSPYTLGARSWPVAWPTRSPYHMIETVLKQASSSGDEFGIHITRRKDTYLLTFS
jgi:hypothetical protein